MLTGLAPGSVIAGYRVESPIGAGGMAMVFRARDEALGRTVALKILTPALAGDAQFRERFVRESRAVAAVDHPYIIPVYAAGEANGVLYLVMRFVVGGDLRALVQREGPLPGDRAVSLLSPIASALDAAHAAGLVHRDVKPANILIDTGPGRPEHPYLSDFGLAKGTASSTGLTGTGQFLGTPDYAAPEQISGKPTSPPTDQYALACVAYTILTGTLPFPRDQSMAVLWAHMYDQPPAVTTLRPDLPVTVNEVIARALAKSPEDRYATCGDFIGALRTAFEVSTDALPDTGSRNTGIQSGWAPRQPVQGVAALSLSPSIPPEPVPPSTLSTPPRPFAATRSQRFGGVTEDRPPTQSLSAPDQTGDTIARPTQPDSSARGADALDSGHRLHGKASRKFSRRMVITSAAVALVLLAGGGASGFWLYDQSRYFVTVQNGHVVIFRGLNSKFAGISLYSFFSQTSLSVSQLSGSAQAALDQTMPTGSLSDATRLVDQLQSEAVQCHEQWNALADWQSEDNDYQLGMGLPAPGPMPTVPDSAQCAPSSAFGIPASRMPAAQSSAAG